MTMALRKRTAACAAPRRRHKNPRSGALSTAPAGRITVTVARIVPYLLALLHPPPGGTLSIFPGSNLAQYCKKKNPQFFSLP